MVLWEKGGKGGGGGGGCRAHPPTLAGPRNGIVWCGRLVKATGSRGRGVGFWAKKNPPAK